MNFLGKSVRGECFMHRMVKFENPFHREVQNNQILINIDRKCEPKLNIDEYEVVLTNLPVKMFDA